LPYISYAIELEDTDNVYAEVTWANGTQAVDYEFNMGGWTPTRFADVSRSDWYFSYVDYAANVLGLINGKGDRRLFARRNMITRHDCSGSADAFPFFSPELCFPAD
jgi:hypothetical protein